LIGLSSLAHIEAAIDEELSLLEQLAASHPDLRRACEAASSLHCKKYLRDYWSSSGLWKSWSQFGTTEAARRLGCDPSKVLTTTNHLESFHNVLKNSLIKRWRRAGRRLRFDVLIHVLATAVAPSIYAKRAATHAYKRWEEERFDVRLEVLDNKQAEARKTAAAFEDRQAKALAMLTGAVPIFLLPTDEQSWTYWCPSQTNAPEGSVARLTSLRFYQVELCYGPAKRVSACAYPDARFPSRTCKHILFGFEWFKRQESEAHGFFSGMAIPRLEEDASDSVEHEGSVRPSHPPLYLQWERSIALRVKPPALPPLATCYFITDAPEGMRILTAEVDMSYCVSLEGALDRRAEQQEDSGQLSVVSEEAVEDATSCEASSPTAEAGSRIPDSLISGSLRIFRPKQSSSEAGKVPRRNNGPSS
jgi:hypothetical protein